jgi:hypothetical protein
LEGGPPSFPRDYTCPAVLKHNPWARALSPTGLSPTLAVVPTTFGYGPTRQCAVRHPRWTGFQPPDRNGDGLDTAGVWAVPGSLTTTTGISVDFYSSGY